VEGVWCGEDSCVVKRGCGFLGGKSSKLGCFGIEGGVHWKMRHGHGATTSKGQASVGSQGSSSHGVDR